MELERRYVSLRLTERSHAPIGDVQGTVVVCTDCILRGYMYWIIYIGGREVEGGVLRERLRKATLKLQPFYVWKTTACLRSPVYVPFLNVKETHAACPRDMRLFLESIKTIHNLKGYLVWVEDG